MNGKLRGNNGGGANCESVWLVRVRVDDDGGDKPHHAEHEKVDGKKLGDLNIYEVYFLPATRFILRFFSLLYSRVKYCKRFQRISF